MFLKLVFWCALMTWRAFSYPVHSWENQTMTSFFSEAAKFQVSHVFFVLKLKKWEQQPQIWMILFFHKQEHGILWVLLTKLIVPTISSTNCTRLTRSYHGYKMQQIHAWLVGFGVSQFEQGWNPKSSSVPGIPPLRSHIQGQNNTHGQTHIHTL